MNTHDDAQPTLEGNYFRVALCEKPECKQIHMLIFNGNHVQIGHFPLDIEAAETLRHQLNHAVKHRLGQPCDDCTS